MEMGTAGVIRPKIQSPPQFLSLSYIVGDVITIENVDPASLKEFQLLGEVPFATALQIQKPLQVS